ncbi:MAG TPA: DUF2304 domain-containing protein [Elusimicrobia bacterium]|nr:MAG: hypothetical protein A2278_01990 [Elusimicrobia bacterium RIFOXYA12_FULL_49_49]OGS06029.1 MAG: hypothetical protein A2204_07640 [Elusimicrobia bacterium RIFOXYA1_FULL_47_7]OGS16817.1 MAG: hypothetical protein A2251_05440 [Elusimicrobia bacterium RIFOXYA2_FULL_47_53]OGS32045.1 MAG: hypothetical protein A2323_08215 [Elusimicrobia bacterium RIFOXYB2_FULL_46_23]HBU69939.1 DUF2304 domain-containing protein [Elusimicrobiota bacterium]
MNTDIVIANIRPQNVALSIIVSAGLLILIFELVRNKKLNEEYSWLWMLTAFALLVLSVFPKLLLWLTHSIGAVAPMSTLFFSGLIFLLLIVLHFSTIISKLSNNTRLLSQKLAILELKLKQLSENEHKK